MGYLIRDLCKGYYKLHDGETPDEFTSCQCGGHLKYSKRIEGVTGEEDNRDSNSSRFICPNIVCGYGRRLKKKPNLSSMRNSSKKRRIKRRHQNT